MAAPSLNIQHLRPVSKPSAMYTKSSSFPPSGDAAAKAAATVARKKKQNSVGGTLDKDVATPGDTAARAATDTARNNTSQKDNELGDGATVGPARDIDIKEKLSKGTRPNDATIQKVSVEPTALFIEHARVVVANQHTGEIQTDNAARPNEAVASKSDANSTRLINACDNTQSTATSGSDGTETLKPASMDDTEPSMPTSNPTKDNAKASLKTTGESVVRGACFSCTSAELLRFNTEKERVPNLSVVELFVKSQKFRRYCLDYGLSGPLFTFNPGASLRLMNRFWENIKEDVSNSKKLALVFHGTREANINAILRDGLDKNKRRGQAFGPGEYFSKSPAASIVYTKGCKKMLVFLVVVPNEQNAFIADRPNFVPDHYVVVNENSHQLPVGVVSYNSVSVSAIARSVTLRSQFQKRLAILQKKAILEQQRAAELSLKADIVQAIVNEDWDLAIVKWNSGKERLSEPSRTEVSYYAHLKQSDKELLSFLFEGLPKPSKETAEKTVEEQNVVLQQAREDLEKEYNSQEKQDEHRRKFSKINEFIRKTSSALSGTFGNRLRRKNQTRSPQTTTVTAAEKATDIVREAHISKEEGVRVGSSTSSALIVEGEEKKARAQVIQAIVIDDLDFAQRKWADNKQFFGQESIAEISHFAHWKLDRDLCSALFSGLPPPTGALAAKTTPKDDDESVIECSSKQQLGEQGKSGPASATRDAEGIDLENQTYSQQKRDWNWGWQKRKEASEFLSSRRTAKEKREQVINQNRLDSSGVCYKSGCGDGTNSDAQLHDLIDLMLES